MASLAPRAALARATTLRVSSSRPVRPAMGPSLSRLAGAQQHQHQQHQHQQRAASASASPTTPSAADAFAAAQQAAPRPSLAEEARTLVQCASLGVLSTLSASGAPSGSVVQYATDPATSRLILSLSTLSAHTRELAADGRCSLTVLSPWGFGSMADARVTLGGLLAAPLPASEAARARAAYLAAHPDAFWADFGDFAWWGLDPAAPGAAARAVLGFGRAGSVPGPAWAATPVDPVSAFSAPVCGHMNADHGDAVVAMVASTGLPGRVVGAAMRKVDALGFDAVAQVAVEEDGEKKGGRPLPPVSVPVRVPFPRRADGRKELKEVLVELTKAAKGGG